MITIRNKELRALLKPLVKAGWTLTQNKHYKLTAPCGRIISISESASDGMFIKGVERDIKRITNNPKVEPNAAKCC